MDHKEFINYITESFECTTESAEAVVKIFSEGISMAMSEGHNVNVDSLGRFAISTIPAHKVRVPGVNKLVTVDARRRPYFTPAKDLKNCCNF